MFKHIIGQSIFQLVVLFVLTFAGEDLIPEREDDLDAYAQALTGD